MSNATSVFVFFALLFVSLLCISAANNRQTRARLVSQRLEQLKRKTEELEEISASVELLVGHTRISYIITQEEIEILERMAQLSPKNQLIQLSIKNTNEQLEALSSGNRLSKTYRICESDAAMAKAQYQLNEAARIVQRHCELGMLDEDALNKHKESLIWAHMMISITTYVAQGHKAIQGGNPRSKAQAYFKKALEIAHATAINDPQRPNLIKELGELVQGSRTALSSQLMPEKPETLNS